MEKRKLGGTELHTAPVVFGGNVFGWTLNEKESFALLDEFFDLGFNSVDTANSYSHWVEGNSGGESETILGNWMKSRKKRDQVLVFTKVGSAMGQGKRDISEKAIFREVENSLRRLKTDYIDLYLTHWDDDKTSEEETMKAYAQLIEQGKVRFVGASNLSPERLTASLQASETYKLPRYEVFQPEYNLYDRKPFESGSAATCQTENLGVITYYSLASGFLSGKYRKEEDFEKSVRGEGVKKYLNDRGKRILKALDKVSDKHQVSQAAVALAWLLATPPVTAPIASATKSKHLQAFSDAASLKLDGEDKDELDKASEY